MMATLSTRNHNKETAMGHAIRALKVYAALAVPGLVPTFRSSRSIAAFTFTSFRPLVAVAAIAAAFSFSTVARAQPAPVPPSTETAAPTADNAVLLTIFLKHDQSRPLSELNAQLDKQGFYKAFPPAGIEVVSWYVMMGIGQVVTLRLPASRLREVNRILENSAWGSYRTEFYPTYDYKPTGLASHEKAQQAK
jgi:hypothetical protein